MSKQWVQINAFAVVLMVLSTVSISMAGTGWSKSMGGGGGEIGSGIATTSDGGFIVVGGANSFGAGGVDGWIVKMDNSGAVQWQKTYGLSSVEFLWSIHQLADGGYITAGGLDENNPAGNGDAWVLRLDASGNILWQKTFGGASFEEAIDARATADGGFIVTARSDSFGANSSVWVLKLNSFGSIQWQKVFGGANMDEPLQILATSDGGSLVVAYTYSFGSGDLDSWLLKLDSSGAIQWQKTYGTSSYDFLGSVKQTADGGYIAAGVSHPSGSHDFVVVKLDSAGSIQWQKTYAGSNVDMGAFIELTTDGGYIVTGITQSFGAGGLDGWVLKLDSAGNVQWQKSYGGGDFDQITAVLRAADGGYFLVGSTESFAIGQQSLWVLKIDADGAIADDCPLATDTFGIATPSTLTSTTTSVVATTPVPTVNTTAATPSNSLATELIQCEQSCVFCDDFEDGVLASDWTYLKPGWNETGGNLVAVPTRKAVAIASPAFAGCSDCAFEAGMMSSGGTGNTVWMLPWYADKNNTLEVLMKEENNKFVIKQRSGGVVVAKAKGLLNIAPNVAYVVRIEHDATTFTLSVDGNVIATMPMAHAVQGTIGFQAKNTTAKFSSILVE